MLLRILALVLLMLTVASAQTQAPLLTDVQRLQIQNAVLRVQLAQSELQRVTEAANALIHSLQKPGYTLDLDKFVYVPVPTKEPPDP
jgi:hypothetical protein